MFTEKQLGRYGSMCWRFVNEYLITLYASSHSRTTHFPSYIIFSFSYKYYGVMCHWLYFQRSPELVKFFYSVSHLGHKAIPNNSNLSMNYLRIMWNRPPGTQLCFVPNLNRRFPPRFSLSNLGMQWDWHFGGKCGWMCSHPKFYRW